jgi:enoyl-CoA hydratase/carnithine racemase
MAYKTITYEVDDRVAVLTFNRPERMNAMTVELCLEVQDAVKAADADPDVRVVVIRGAGGKAFSAGYDLVDSAEGEKKGLGEWRDRLNQDLQFTQSVWRCSKPTIAMISGYCLGGALEFVQMCDIRYASDDSKFGVVETRFSMGIATMIMPWVVGARCREYIYTGDTFGSEEAMRIGVVNRVFPKADLESETMKVAKRMSRIALAALQWNKRALNNTFEAMGLQVALQYAVEACAILDSTETPEFKAFEEVQNAKGLTEAIKWRRELFRPFE